MGTDQDVDFASGQIFDGLRLFPGASETRNLGHLHWPRVCNIPCNLREAITKDARRILEQLYQDPDLTMPNHAGQLGEKCHPGRAKEVETLFGPITLRRKYFYNESTDAGRAPFVRIRDMTPTSVSTALLVGPLTDRLSHTCALCAAQTL